MQNEERKLEIINYIEKASVVLLSLMFLLFPLIFSDLTTDFFMIPKQALVIFVVLSLILLFGIKTLLLERVRIKRTPFDLPVLGFLLALLLSTIFSVSFTDSLTNFIPVLFAGLAFFAIVYNAKNEKSLMVLFSCFLGGAVLLALFSVFTYFKVFIFPFDFAKANTFTTTGSMVEQALYLLAALLVGLYFVTPLLKRKASESQVKQRAEMTKAGVFGLISAVVGVGLIVSIYNIIKLTPAIILPMESGFQTAFASISQDSGRIFQGLLFGTGFGEYLVDFSRFKQASFNTNPTLWSLTFIRSSSFVLELLATAGVLGLLSYLFLGFKIIKERPLFIPLIILFAISFVLPFSFFTLTLLFFLLGLYAALRGLNNDSKYFDVDLQLVAFKKGFLAFTSEGSRSAHGYGKALSYIIFAVIAVLVVLFGFLTFDFLSANLKFQKSRVAAAQNNGQLTYTYQSSALANFTGKYMDSYQRVFSQTNLALASSLAASVPQGTQPAADTTQTIYTLVQQSINAAREATNLSPKNALNWQNLSSIYRSLIGFGQNADSFAIVAQQQAVQLDPSNPQQYITLGGIYYQLKSWENAKQQFRQAITLKQDYPNAYYNLGHVLQEQGDLEGALAQYQIVKQLVANDPENAGKMDSEIAAIQSQLGAQKNAQNQATQPAQDEKTPLSVPTPSSALPKQNPPVKIPAPGTDKTTPTPTGGPTPTPST